MHPDTLQVDSTQLSVFQSDSRYNYDRELVGGSQDLLEWLATVVNDWIRETFDVVMDNDVTYYILIGIGILTIAFLLWLYWRIRPKLFTRGEKGDALDYEVDEDTIYGVDFDADIRQAVALQDYRQAVRLLYLQTLKQLEDQGRIEWNPSKTPAQYMRQVNQPSFSEMSRLFIQVRYGNFDATEDMYERMKALQVSLQEGGAL